MTIRHQNVVFVVVILLAGQWGMASDWLHFGADSVYSAHNVNERRIGASNVADLEQLWGIGCNDGWFSVISASPAIRNGVLYTSGAGELLRAYEARTGRLLWDFGQGNMGWASQPVASCSGTVYYMEGSYPTELYAVDGATGQQIWQAPLGFDLGYVDTARVTVDEEQQLVYLVEEPFAPGEGKIFALDAATGAVEWWKGQTTDDLGFKGDDVLLDGGTIYVVAVDEDEHSWRFEKVVAIDAASRNITAVYSRPADIELKEISRISICGNALIVNFCDRDDVFEGDGVLAAFDLATGAELWRLQAGSAFTGRLACNASLGVTYVPDGPVLRALRVADGSETWSYPSYDDIYNPSLANGVLYFVSDTNMYALDEGDGEQLFRYGLGADAYDTTQVAVADGMAYFSGNGGTCDLYALGVPGDNPDEAIDGFIPAAAKNAGAGGTVWRTTVWAFQDETEVATLILRAGNEAQPATGVEAYRIAIPQGRVIRLDDVLSHFPAVTPPAALFYSWQGVQAAQAVVTSRTFTAAPEGAEGTLGQGIPAIDLNDLPAAGASHVVPLSPDNDIVRSNLGVVNASTDEADFTLRVRSEAGEVLGELGFSLPGGSWRQFNGVFSSLGLPVVDLAYAEVTTTHDSGAGTPLFAIYASLVDNTSGDPTYLAGQWARDFGAVVIPVAAHNPGANGTQWVTDISTLNWQGRDGTVCSFTFLAEGVANHPSAAGSRSFAVDADHHLYLPDAVLNLYGETNRKGAVLSSGWPDNRWSRTYNTSEDGTYGQGLPGLEVSEHEIAGANRGLLIGLGENADFRTNLGLVNTSTEQSTVTVLYKSAAGTTLGTEMLSLPPRGMQQISAPLAVYGEVRDAQVQVSSDNGVLVYASVVDNHTGDASTMLSQRLGNQ